MYNNEHNKGIDIIENIYNVYYYNTVDLLIVGDLNARTACERDILNVNKNIPLFREYDEMFEDVNIPIRKSCDTLIYRFGKQLIELCKCFSLCILNGRIGVDSDHGHFTFISHLGNSVIDYNIFHLVKGFIVDDLADCEHFPIIVKCQGINNDITRSNTDEKNISVKRVYCFNDDDISHYQKMFSNNKEEGHYKSIDTMIGNVICPINDIVVEFENILIECSSDFCTSSYNRKQKSNKTWFDI
jgi:hypothetical protein